MSRQTDYSDGDDSSDNNNPIRNTPTLTIATSKSRNNWNSTGPLLPHIEQKLATLLMPKLINDKLSPSGMSPVTIGTLIHKFGLHAPALYQMILSYEMGNILFKPNIRLCNNWTIHHFSTQEAFSIGQRLHHWFFKSTHDIDKRFYSGTYTFWKSEPNVYRLPKWSTLGMA